MRPSAPRLLHQLARWQARLTDDLPTGDYTPLRLPHNWRWATAKLRTNMNTFSRRTLLGLGAATARGDRPSLAAPASPGPMRVSWYGPDPVTKALNKALDAWKSSGGAEIHRGKRSLRRLLGQARHADLRQQRSRRAPDVDELLHRLRGAGVR